MSEIDVEAVERVEDDSEASEYVLYGGKGGVGKTTMAAATALSSARAGTKTLVVSTDPAHSLSDTFETEISAEPARIRVDDPLWAVEIDPDSALEDADLFSGGHGDGSTGGSGPLGSLGGMLGDDEEGLMNPLLGGTMPGADEAAAMQQLLAYLDDDRFERVVDTAPTGHTLRLLELPEVMDTMVGRILTLRQKLGGMMDGVKGMFGSGDDDSEADDQPGMDDLEAFRERIEHLRSTLRDPAKTDFRVVMVPEEMSVMESERLLSRLAKFDIPVGTVVVNRVMESLADVASDPDVDQDAFLSPDLEDCAFCQRRWEVQKAALARAQDVFRGHDVERVPLFADEVRGEKMLSVVASCLSS